MSDETEAKYYKAAKVLLIAVSLLLVGNGVYHLWQCRSSTGADNNVTRTMEQLQTANESARSEAESAGREIAGAEGHIERAADAVGRSEEAAQRNADGVEELQGIVSECREIVKNQREFIQEVERANGIGAQESTEN